MGDWRAPARCLPTRRRSRCRQDRGRRCPRRRRRTARAGWPSNAQSHGWLRSQRGPVTAASAASLRRRSSLSAVAATPVPPLVAAKSAITSSPEPLAAATRGEQVTGAVRARDGGPGLAAGMAARVWRPGSGGPGWRPGSGGPGWRPGMAARGRLTTWHRPAVVGAGCRRHARICLRSRTTAAIRRGDRQASDQISPALPDR